MKLIRKLKAGEGAQWPIIAIVFAGFVVWFMFAVAGCVLNGPNLSPAG